MAPATIEPAGEFTQHQHALFLGRGVQYPAAPNGPLLDKLKPHLQEVRARRSPDRIAEAAVFTVPLQLLADHVAVRRGTDVDQPRNLARSVTVASERRASGAG